MSVFYPATIDNDVRKALEHLFEEEALNPSKPIAPSYRPYFTFKFGERLTKCEQGKPIVAAWPDGQTEAYNGASEIRQDYFFRIQVVSGGDDRTSQDLFFEGLSKIKSAFGLTSINHTYKNTFSHTRPDGVEMTTEAPFKLGALGIQQSVILSSTSPRRLPDGDCRSLSAEILIRWRFYLSAC